MSHDRGIPIVIVDEPAALARLVKGGLHGEIRAGKHRAGLAVRVWDFFHVDLVEHYFYAHAVAALRVFDEDEFALFAFGEVAVAGCVGGGVGVGVVVGVGDWVRAGFVFVVLFHGRGRGCDGGVFAEVVHSCVSEGGHH